MRWWQLLLLLISSTSSCLLENGMNSVYLSVFEDLQPGKIVGELPIKGEVTGEKPDLSLKLIKGKDLIELEPGTKKLKLKTPLDRDEGSSRFEAVVECKSSDLDADFNQLNISVFVTVKDVNDNAPEFDAEEYNITIKEELPIGTIVFADFEATDRDQPGPNSFIQYSIVDGDFSNLLEIADPFKPVVTIKNRIDYEKIKEFEVEIEARDQGEPSQFSRVPLRVTVENVNDLNPYFTQKLYRSSKIKDGQLVLQPEPIQVFDADELGANIEFTLEGDASSFFTIDKRGVILVTKENPPTSTTLFVNAVESDNKERNATAIVLVNLENPIRFEHQMYSTKISQAAGPGSVVLVVKAVNNEMSDDMIIYSLRDSAHDIPLSINVQTGEITIAGHINKVGKYSLNITATSSLTAESTIVPFMLTVYEDSPLPTVSPIMSSCPPAISISNESTIIFEKSEFIMAMSTNNHLPVLGNIKLSTESSRVSKYILLNMNRDFSVDERGVVRLKSGARPVCSTCELIVQASDEAGSMALTKVTIKNSLYSISTSSVLTVLILILLTLIFSILLIIICRKMHYAWRSHKRTSICWMNNTNDTGITITGTMPTPSRYVVNNEKERAFETTKSPAPKRAQGAHLVPVTVTNQDGAPTVYF